MKYSKLKTFTEQSHYKVEVEWNDLEYHIRHAEIDLNPDFQRGHVWTKEQQIKYIEFKLSGGFGSNVILTNCSGWMDDFKGPYQLVDGLQRITAVLDFFHNKFKIFNKYYFKDFEGRVPSYLTFEWHVNNLNTKAEVLKWYLEVNTGGVVHTQEELNRVKKLLDNQSK